MKNIEFSSSFSREEPPGWSAPPPLSRDVINLLDKKILQKFENRHPDDHELLMLAKSPDLMALGILTVSALTLVMSIEAPIYFVYKKLFDAYQKNKFGGRG